MPVQVRERPLPFLCNCGKDADGMPFLHTCFFFELRRTYGLNSPVCFGNRGAMSR